MRKIQSQSKNSLLSKGIQTIRLNQSCCHSSDYWQDSWYHMPSDGYLLQRLLKQYNGTSNLLLHGEYAAMR